MNLEEILASAASNEVTIPAIWAQGRATFGGLTGALACERMQSVVTPGRPLRAMQVSFVGPVEPGVPVALEVELLREGKAVSQAMVRMVQDGTTRLVAMGAYGSGRESVVSVPPLSAPEAPVPEDCAPTPFIKGRMPDFAQFIEMRWCFGSRPFTGEKHRDMGGWMRFRETPSQLDDPAIVALIDAWPPVPLSHLTEFAPNSSLTWSVEMMDPRPTVKVDDWLMYRAEIDKADDGYANTHAQIWNRQGELVAISRQTVTVFG
ncbi:MULTISPECIES: acyl-CoA thioesterase [Marinobacter]|mgnify:CR=1 FL=1|uniref:Acyl-CoA thioesterase n=1 Tax=Marinobacter segnicrescens TaxID=430453 RepID=A0A1I0G2Z2_9GAMM|nr:MULTISPECIES: thioesterase family protein [Marinobacter]UZD66849.1 thioesterase family protein [Marinobacter sp. AN1]SET64249.1 Acyl-CoA thioesterase [Marinobacter segnicrescens]